MNIPPLPATAMIAGACLIILPLAGVPLSALKTPAGLLTSVFVLVIISIVLALLQPVTRAKAKGPAHPMTKAGNLFALIAAVFAVLSLALNAGLGLVTAGVFMMVAVVCWVFGSVLRNPSRGGHEP